MNQTGPEPADELSWLPPAIARKPAARPARGVDAGQPLGPFSVAGAQVSPTGGPADDVSPPPAADPQQPAHQVAEPWLEQTVAPGGEAPDAGTGFGSEPTEEDSSIPWAQADSGETLPWLEIPASDASAAPPAGEAPASGEEDPLAELDPIPDDWWDTEADALAETAPWMESGEAPEIGFAWEDDPEPLPEVATTAAPEPLLDEELVAMAEWPQQDSIASEGGWSPFPAAFEPLVEDAAAPDASAPASAVEPSPTPEFEEIAARLEKIAQALRSGRPADLLGSMDDPLQALIAGYALGAAERSRRGS
jgi:hypothetical protein